MCVRWRGSLSGFGRWWPWSSDAGLCWVPVLSLSRFRTVRRGLSVMVFCRRTVASPVHHCTDGNVRCARSTHCPTRGPSCSWKVCPRRELNAIATMRWRRNGWQTKFVWRWKARFVAFIMSYLAQYTVFENENLWTLFIDRDRGFALCVASFLEYWMFIVYPVL